MQRLRWCQRKTAKQVAQRSIWGYTWRWRRWELQSRTLPGPISNSKSPTSYILQVGYETTKTRLGKVSTESWHIRTEHSSKHSTWRNTNTTDQGRGLISDYLGAWWRVWVVISIRRYCHCIAARRLTVAFESSQRAWTVVRALLDTVSVGKVSRSWIEKVGIGVVHSESIRISTDVAVHICGSEGFGGVAIGIAIGAEVDHGCEHGPKDEQAQDIPALPIGFAHGSMLDVSVASKFFVFIVISCHFLRNNLNQ